MQEKINANTTKINLKFQIEDRKDVKESTTSTELFRRAKFNQTIKRNQASKMAMVGTFYNPHSIDTSNKLELN